MRRPKRPNTACANCATDRYPIQAGGYCNRCYRLVRRLEIIHSWNLKAPASLRGYPQGRPFQKEAVLRILKAGFSDQIRRRLEFLKHRELQRKAGVDGLTIEHLLRKVAKAAGARGDVHYGVASLVDHTFPPAQKRALFCLLQDIEDRTPWRGPDVAEAFKKFGDA